MKWDDFVVIARELPEVEEATSYGRPADEEQDFLIEAAPAIYYITDHYKGYPAVLARPGKLTKKEARGRLEQAWRKQAPKALVKKFDAA